MRELNVVIIYGHKIMVLKIFNDIEMSFPYRVVSVLPKLDANRWTRKIY